MLTLGFESSCDDTSVALVADGTRVVANLISSQIEIHRRFGGVVPEVASRKHLEAVTPMLGEVLAIARDAGDPIGRVAATTGPGLLGALLVGMSAAKAAALALRIPFVPVNHLEAHLSAAFLGAGRAPTFPFVGLVVSGGHALLTLSHSHRQIEIISQTHDDAPGELFDKIARVLELGYPGGPVIQKTATAGNPKRYALPRPMADRPEAMSFSGLKTAVLNLMRTEGDRLVVADLCASLQEAVCDTLAQKVTAALGRHRPPLLVLAGGVAANQPLRERLAQVAAAHGCEFLVPPLVLCTDNAAMIAANGHWVADSHRDLDGLTVNASANWAIGAPIPT